MLKWRLASRQMLRSSVKAHIALRRRTLASHGGHVGVDAGRLGDHTSLSVRSKNGEGLFSAPFPLPPSNSEQFSAAIAASEAQHLRGVRPESWGARQAFCVEIALRMADILQSWGVAPKNPQLSNPSDFNGLAAGQLSRVCVSVGSPTKTATRRSIPRSALPAEATTETGVLRTTEIGRKQQVRLWCRKNDSGR